MVNIFGFKLFEGSNSGSSMESQMSNNGRKSHHKYRHRHHKHGPGKYCPLCDKKGYKGKKYRGGYTYKQSKQISEEDVTMSLKSQSKTKTRTRSNTKNKTKKHHK